MQSTIVVPKAWGAELSSGSSENTNSESRAKTVKGTEMQSGVNRGRNPYVGAGVDGGVEKEKDGIRIHQVSHSIPSPFFSFSLTLRRFRH